MVYHIFNYRIQGTWYRDSAPCSDELFDAVMEKLEWQLPNNMRVYHYGSPGPQYYPLDNPIMLRRPILSLCPMELVTNGAAGGAALYDRQRQLRLPVCSRLGRFVLCHDMAGWPHFYYADGIRFRLAADMQIVPLAFSEARAFVDRYHRHNAAPQGHKFSIGLSAAGVEGYIGIAIASIPKARALNDGLTLEINRVCCDPAYDNACSKLYGAAIKAWATGGSLPTHCLRRAAAASRRWDSAMTGVQRPDPPAGIAEAGRAHSLIDTRPAPSADGSWMLLRSIPGVSLYR